jgi:DNA-binding transcriptional MerR regulator
MPAIVGCGPYSTVKEKTVLIGEAAQKAGVSRDTVRLYTRLGLVACASRGAGSRVYADYDQDAVELIKNIKVAQSIGFSLSELVPIADAYVAGRLDDAEQRLLLEAKLAEIDERRLKLEHMSGFLRAKLGDLSHTTIALTRLVADRSS